VIEFKPDVDDRSKDAVIGCIGAGMIMAECHLPAYQETGFKVGAIASRTQANAAGFSPNAYLRHP
jgi:predicted dehydrogenase